MSIGWPFINYVSAKHPARHFTYKIQQGECLDPNHVDEDTEADGKQIA